jgi:hypothetical protein
MKISQQQNINIKITLKKITLYKNTQQVKIVLKKISQYKITREKITLKSDGEEYEEEEEQHLQVITSTIRAKWDKLAS